MRRKTVPSYLFHKQSGRARAVWTDANGVRQQRLLPGAFESPESRAAHARLSLELATGAPTATQATGGIAVAVMLARFLDFAERHYRGPDGKPSSEFTTCKLVMKALRELYGDVPAADLSPLKLKAVRQSWVEAGLSRSECNRRTKIVRRIVKWAAGEELIPASVYHGLAVVTGLQKGRSEARECEPVKPVDDSTVDATLPHVNRFVRGMIEVQQLTGMRPGEVVILRRCDIDTGGAVWLYKPARHKNAWRGKPRTIAIGPRAQAVLREFFTTNIDDYLFSPARAVEEFHAARYAARKTPKYPSHMARNAAKRTPRPGRPPAERYTPGSYALAVSRACDIAFPPPAPIAKTNGETLAAWDARLTQKQREELKAWRDAHRWAPNQLRHTHATKVRKQFGLEAAGATLGHAKMSATEIYAERDAGLAVEVASKIG